MTSPEKLREYTFTNPYGERQTLAVGGVINHDSDWLELFRAEGFEPPHLQGWKD